MLSLRMLVLGMRLPCCEEAQATWRSLCGEELRPQLTRRAELPVDGQHNIGGKFFSAELCPDSTFMNKINDQ